MVSAGRITLKNGYTNFQWILFRGQVADMPGDVVETEQYGYTGMYTERSPAQTPFIFRQATSQHMRKKKERSSRTNRLSVGVTQPCGHQ